MRDILFRTQSAPGRRYRRTKKRADSNCVRASLALLQISSDSGDDTDAGGSGAHSSMMGPWNSRSTDKVCSIHTGNSHSRMDSCSSHTGRPDNQIRFRLKPARQNAARERKPIHLPLMQLTEAFSL